VEHTGTHVEDCGTEWKKEDIEGTEDIECTKNNKNDFFEFWKEYPHARK
jgi:hypothetical protein